MQFKEPYEAGIEAVNTEVKCSFIAGPPRVVAVGSGVSVTSGDNSVVKRQALHQ